MPIPNFLSYLVCIFLILNCKNNTTHEPKSDTLNQVDEKGRKQGYWKHEYKNVYEPNDPEARILYNKYIDGIKQEDEYIITDTLGRVLTKGIREGNVVKIYDENNNIKEQKFILPSGEKCSSNEKNGFSIGYFDFNKGQVNGISHGKGYNSIEISFYKSGGIKEISETIYFVKGVVNQSVQKKFDQAGHLLQVKDYGYDDLLVDEVFDNNEKKWNSGKGKKIQEVNFYCNGRIESKKFYRLFYHQTLEEPENTWQYYSENGKLIKEEIYQYGKLIKTKVYE